MFVSLCLTLPVIQRNLRMVEINKYYYYYYYIIIIIIIKGDPWLIKFQC